MLSIKFEPVAESTTGEMRGIVFKHNGVELRVEDVAEGQFDDVLHHLLSHNAVSVVRMPDGTLDCGDALSVAEVAALVYRPY